MKLLLYCTKGKPILYKRFEWEFEWDCFSKDKDKFYLGDCIELNDELSGKVVAECDFEVEEIIPDDGKCAIQHRYSKELLEMSCLDALDLWDYLKGKNGYAIHIKNLKVFDEPKELFGNAPQNMCYCRDIFGNRNVLISIQPKWLCKILNGEKTIEIRKKVLKEMTNDNK